MNHYFAVFCCFALVAMMFTGGAFAKKTTQAPTTTPPTTTPTPPTTTPAPTCPQNCQHYGSLIYRCCNGILPDPAVDACGWQGYCLDPVTNEVTDRCYCRNFPGYTSCAHDNCRCSTDECSQYIGMFNSLNCANTVGCGNYTCTA